MVEPIEIALNKIPDHDNLTKVSGTIDKDFNIRTLTKLKDKFWDDPNIDRDYLGMASLQSNNILSQDNFYQNMIEEIEVGCVTFEFLMEQLNITEVDYLKIDTEGLDYDILNSIDFNKFNIKAIRAEHQHVNLSLLVDLLEKNNYLVDVLENDIIAIK